eukprot:scaffold175316_cov51-Prasinocladus_malaysianus.AAC.1
MLPVHPATTDPGAAEHHHLYLRGCGAAKPGRSAWMAMKAWLIPKPRAHGCSTVNPAGHTPKLKALVGSWVATPQPGARFIDGARRGDIKGTPVTAGRASMPAKSARLATRTTPRRFEGIGGRERLVQTNLAA